jgi:hypothetical protein
VVESINLGEKKHTDREKGIDMSTLESNSIAPIIECINSSIKNSSIRKKGNKVINFIRISEEEVEENRRLNFGSDSILCSEGWEQDFDTSLHFSEVNFDFVSEQDTRPGL